MADYNCFDNSVLGKQITGLVQYSLVSNIHCNVSLSSWTVILVVIAKRANNQIRMFRPIQFFLVNIKLNDEDLFL